MPYTLRYFSDFISQQFRASAHDKRSVPYHQIKHQLFEHARHCRNQLIAETLACTTQDQLNLRIRNEQVLIIVIMDQLDVSVNFGTDPDMYYAAENDGVDGLAKHLFMILEDMLHYLFTYFISCFDAALHLPSLYRRTKSIEFGQSIAAVRYGLRDKRVGEDLLKVLEQPLDTLVGDHSGRKTTFFQYFYLVKLLEGIRSVLASQSKDMSADLFDLLLGFNLNSPAFRDHCISTFKSEVNTQSHSSDKKKLLRSLIGKMQQKCSSTDLTWDPASPPLKDMLMIWLQSELDLLDWKPVTAESQIKNDTAGTPAIIQTIMTVPQMAHMLRLMLETGVYINIGPLDAIRFQSGNFTAPLSKNISTESMRQKYYTPDTPTAAAVRTLLRKMITHSNKLAP